MKRNFTLYLVCTLFVFLPLANGQILFEYEVVTDYFSSDEDDGASEPDTYLTRISGELTYEFAGVANLGGGDQSIYQAVLSIVNHGGDDYTNSSVTAIALHRPFEAGTNDSDDDPLDMVDYPVAGEYFTLDPGPSTFLSGWDVLPDNIPTDSGGSTNLLPLPDEPEDYLTFFTLEESDDWSSGVNQGESAEFTFHFAGSPSVQKLDEQMYNLISQDLLFRIMSGGPENEWSEKLRVELSIIPEPSTVGFVSFIGIIGFLVIRGRRKAKD